MAEYEKWIQEDKDSDIIFINNIEQLSQHRIKVGKNTVKFIHNNIMIKVKRTTLNNLAELLLILNKNGYKFVCVDYPIYLSNYNISIVPPDKNISQIVGKYVAYKTIELYDLEIK